jgi:hypothetical protein
MTTLLEFARIHWRNLKLLYLVRLFLLEDLLATLWG